MMQEMPGGWKTKTRKTKTRKSTTRKGKTIKNRGSQAKYGKFSMESPGTDTECNLPKP